jgi:hypothetical protein
MLFGPLKSCGILSNLERSTYKPLVLDRFSLKFYPLSAKPVTILRPAHCPSDRGV